MVQGMLLEMWMDTRCMGLRCDRWEPRGRPEPTSTMHVHGEKLRPVGLAVLTDDVSVLLGTNGYTRHR